MIGPMVYIKNYIFSHFFQDYLVLLTMVPRNSKNVKIGEMYQGVSFCVHRRSYQVLNMVPRNSLKVKKKVEGSVLKVETPILTKMVTAMLHFTS